MIFDYYFDCLDSFGIDREEEERMITPRKKKKRKNNNVLLFCYVEWDWRSFNAVSKIVRVRFA
jgi:hypothetical protein